MTIQSVEKYTPIGGLYELDRSRLAARHILVLYVISKKPGINGLDIAHVLNRQNRSNVQTNIAKLVQLKYVEDRRIDIRKASPGFLYITEEGEKFLRSVIG